MSLFCKHKYQIIKEIKYYENYFDKYHNLLVKTKIIL